MYECAVLMRICSQRKYDKFLLSIANHAKDTSPDGDLEMDTVEAAMFVKNPYSRLTSLVAACRYRSCSIMWSTS